MVRYFGVFLLLFPAIPASAQIFQIPIDPPPELNIRTNPIEVLADWTQDRLPSFGCGPAECQILVMNFRVPDGVSEGFGVQLADELSSEIQKTNPFAGNFLFNRTIFKTYLRVSHTSVAVLQSDEEFSTFVREMGADVGLIGNVVRIQGDRFAVFVRLLSAKRKGRAVTAEIAITRTPPRDAPPEPLQHVGGIWNGRYLSPACFYMPNPPYTQEARAAKFEGKVQTEAIIQTDGSLGNVHVLNSPGFGLAEQILKAMSIWKCVPLIENGQPRATPVQFEIKFHLPENK